MAPAATADIPIHSVEGITGSKQTSYPVPLKLSGALDGLSWEDTTPVIGREFVGVNIVDDILNAPNAEERLRDLAITISQRGVVFFRAQDNLTDGLQKQFIQALGVHSGKPSTSTLHVHPILNGTNEFGVAGDNQISTISSLARKKIFAESGDAQRNKRRYDSAQWHSDIQFEPCPADYTSLRLTELPETGGDTLWASGYELYDRFSRAYQVFFEGLTATFTGDGFIAAAERDPENVKIYEEARGSPLHVGKGLTTVHPIVRTNPVTGWKSLFAVGPFPKVINELEAEESRELLNKFSRTVAESHDLQVRFKWRNKNDIAIWDNRSAFHTATFDYQGERLGHRVVGIGEQPYLDPNSSTRTAELGLDQD